MDLPSQRIRIISGTPIEVGDYRLLLSVLVNTVEGKGPSGRFLMTKLRPVSLVAQGPEGAKWHEIPNETGNVLSVMAAVAAGIAAFSLVVIGFVNLVRRMGE